MARTISRAEKMDKTIVFRATQDDRAAIKLAAQQRGIDISQLIRGLLIRERILTPTGDNKTDTSF